MSSFSEQEQRFLQAVARVLIPASARAATHIDVLANVERTLTQASADYRRKVVRIVKWSRRVSWLYGGSSMPLRARRSRVVLIQKLAHALSALCLVAFWGDDASYKILE